MPQITMPLSMMMQASQHRKLELYQNAIFIDMSVHEKFQKFQFMNSQVAIQCSKILEVFVNLLS